MEGWKDKKRRMNAHGAQFESGRNHGWYRISEISSTFKEKKKKDKVVLARKTKGGVESEFAIAG